MATKRNDAEFRLSMPSDVDIERMFNAVQKLDKHAVQDRALSAAAVPIIRRARQLTPRSSATGTAKKRSKNQLKEANWEYPLWKTIKRVFRKYATGYGIVVVGPEWPEGNKAYFNTSPKGNKGHLWGYQGREYPRKKGGVHKAGPPKARIQVRNWIVQAFDETKEQQLQAIKTKLTELTDRMMRENPWQP